MKRTSIEKGLFCFAVAISACLAPKAYAQQPSSIDVAQARELLNEGLALRSKGDNRAAIEKLKAAHALARTPITGIELGRTYMAGGQLVEARETFLSIARIAPQPEETQRSKAARAEASQLAEQLRSRIPSLTIRVTGVPADAVAVTVDGAAVPSEALAAPRFVDPGTHHVFARSTSGGTAETTAELKEGEAREVELKIVFTDGGQTNAPASNSPRSAESPLPVVTDRAGSESSAGRSHVLDWSLIGGGAAIGVAGGILMIVETSKASDANNNHDKGAYDSAVSAWTVGLVGTIVGGAAVAGGVVLLAFVPDGNGARSSQASVRLGIGVNSLRLDGTW
jgi:hypothetical protein